MQKKSNNNIKICFMTVPVRDAPTTFPPLGVTRMIDSLTDSGFEYQKNTFFYNTDLIRPSDDDLIKYFKELKPNIIGISAVVSTSYSFVKRISKKLKECMPEVDIVLGGNLAAASEVLLKKTSVDLCVIGEGEDSIIELCHHWGEFKSLKSNDELKLIKGLTFPESSERDKIFFTGYRQQINKGSIRQANYKILDEYYLSTGNLGTGFDSDPRLLEIIKQGKKTAGIELSKGCVSRCTFCHRWNKGYRVMDLDKIMANIKMLMEDYDVGILDLYDENFGANKQHIRDFCERIKPLNILWHVSGMRVKTVADRSILHVMKDAGCISIKFGMESGSDRMLKIMEKLSTSVADNYNALLALKETGLLGTTTIQLVMGMPGENRQTLKETYDFVQKCKKFTGKVNVAASLAQALPGTPLFEFARAHKYIGSQIEDEEEYLIRVSDKDKSDFSHYLNMTEESTPEVLYWQYLLRSEHYSFYEGSRGKLKYLLTVLLKVILTPFGFKNFIKVLLAYRYSNKDWSKTLGLFKEKRKEGLNLKTKSLRKTVLDIAPDFKKVDIPYSVDVIRAGR
ncbi:hypothetical protein BVY03_03340 [bacterium K02(2017)]|nr:hypothetical protein BVY03_03340 [bacterium K02(2017)]